MHKNKLLASCYILAVLLSNIQCFHPIFDKDVNCTAKYSVYLNNNSTDTLGVRFIKTQYKFTDQKITFEKETCIVMPYTHNSNVIQYTWTGNNSCVFEMAKFYYVFADVYKTSTPGFTTRKRLAPWDTLKSNGPSFCGNCTYTYSDTLVLP